MSDIADEIKNCGRYVFWKNEVRLKGYRNIYKNTFDGCGRRLTPPNTQGCHLFGKMTSLCCNNTFSLRAGAILQIVTQPASLKKAVTAFIAVTKKFQLQIGNSGEF